MLNNNPYVLYKDWVRYYIVPSSEFPLTTLPSPNKFISFYFKYNAEQTLQVMNQAWRDGFRCSSFFGGKP